MPRSPILWSRGFSRLLMLSGLLFCLVCPGFARGARADCSPVGGLHINEVRYFDRSLPDDGYLTSLVEIYNKGLSPISLASYVVTSADGTVRATLPAWTLPAGGVLEIRFATGDPDSDFTDNLGTFYTNSDSVNVFAHDADGVALYDSAGGTIQDFMAWSSTGAAPFGPAYSDAVTLGLWSAGDFAPTDPLESLHTLRLVPDGYDTNSGDDWDHFGWAQSLYNSLVPGPNAIQSTPINGSIAPPGPVLFQWSQVVRALSYRLVIAADSLMTSVETDTVVVDDSASVYVAGPVHYWTVTPSDSCGPISGGQAWSFMDASLFPAPQRVGPSKPNQVTALGVVGVAREFQHKDSRLLCLYDNATNTRPGCTELAGDGGPWDGPHPLEHASFRKLIPLGGFRFRVVLQECPHCHNYCARACVAMLNHFYGGDLLQDRISFHYGISGGFPPNNPEGSLGHDMPVVRAATRTVLTWALKNSQIVGNNEGTAPTYAQIKARAVAGFPIMAGVPGHVFIVDGYCDAGSLIFGLPRVNMIHVRDPWPTGMSDWMPYTAVNFNGYWHIAKAGAAAIAGLMQEPSVTTDTDGDGVMGFDEGGLTIPRAADRPRALQSEPNLVDTDGDDVNDKQEIRAYTFHRTDHAAHSAAQVNALAFADVDGDGLRAEADCDADNDGDWDGAEDINGNGKNPEAGETCLFDAASKAIDFKTSKPVYLTTENVLFQGGTVRADTFYSYRVYAVSKPACDTTFVVGSKYSNNWIEKGALLTDAAGNIKPSPRLPFPEGCYAVFLDVGRDSLYGRLAGTGRIPNLCDIKTRFMVVRPVTESELAGPFAELDAGRVKLSWLVASGTGATSLQIERAASALGPWTELASYSGDLARGTAQEFDDRTLAEPGDYFYRIKASLASGNKIFGPVQIRLAPAPLRILADHNPVRGAARFALSLPRAGRTRLLIYNTEGRVVRHALDGALPMGASEYQWDGRDDSGTLISGGVYFARLQIADGRNRVFKLTYLR